MDELIHVKDFTFDVSYLKELFGSGRITNARFFEDIKDAEEELTRRILVKEVLAAEIVIVKDVQDKKAYVLCLNKNDIDSQIYLYFPYNSFKECFAGYLWFKGQEALAGYRVILPISDTFNEIFNDFY